MSTAGGRFRPSLGPASPTLGDESTAQALGDSAVFRLTQQLMTVRASEIFL